MEVSSSGLSVGDLYAKIGLMTVQIDVLQTELAKLKEEKEDVKED